MLDQLSKESFESRKGESFVLTAGGSAPGPAPIGPYPLELTEVRGNGLRGKAAREQFSVVFRGPREPVLPQRIYRLENATMGVLEIFLVPVGRDQAGVDYEAIFT